jgi:predicted CxxxxCH...CXXCH cytochrome family protein
MRARGPILLLLLGGAIACDIGAVDPPASSGAGGAGGPDGGAGDLPQGARYHPVGWAEPAQHGPELELQAQDCRGCHGADLTGDTARAAPSCDTCHTPAEPQAWRSDCTFCHGGDADATGAPPRDIDGSSSDVSFAPHTVHVAQGVAAASACTECHVAPLDVLTPGHVFDATPAAAEVSFVAGLSAQASYDGQTCTNTYCHGNGRADSGTIAKSAAPLPCSGCHATDGSGMSGDHSRHINGENMDCSECHDTVVNLAQAIIAPALHVDGARQVSFSAGGTYNPANRTCSGVGCHGTETW